MAKKGSKEAIAPVKMTRTFQYPIEKVFGLWSSAEQFKKWWQPCGFKVVNAYVEPHSGG